MQNSPIAVRRFSAQAAARPLTKTLAAVFRFLTWLSLGFSPTGLAITEAEFIEKVLAQDKLLEEAQIGLHIKQIELDASRDKHANWKAELSAEVGYKRTRDKQIHTSNKDGFLSTSPYTRDSKDTPRKISVDFDKRFLSNPGSVTFGISRSKDTIRKVRYKRNVTSSTRCRNREPEPTDVCDTKHTYFDKQHYGGYQTEYYAQARYPLLKHDGNAASLKSYRRNIYDLRDQELSFLETKEDFLSGRLEDFLNWVLYHRQRQINTDLLAALQNLQPAGDAEAALIGSLIAQTENARQDAEVKRQALVDRLAILLNDTQLRSETPQFDTQKRIAPITENARVYLAKYSRDLQRLQIDMELNELEIAYNKNRLLPSLDLTLRADKLLDDTGTATMNYDDDTTNYAANLEFSYPLGGSITTKAELVKRALNTRKLQIQYEERIESLDGDLQELTRLLDFDEQRLLDAIAATEQSTRLQLQQYQQKALSISDLLQAYRDESTAKLDHLDDLIDYHMNGIEYNNLLDRMIKTP